MRHKSNHILDFRGIVSSFSLLKICQFFKEMAVGEILEIRGCDADTRADLFKILPPVSYRLAREDADPDSCIRIVKTESDPSPNEPDELIH